MEGILGEDGGRIFLHSEGEPSGSHAAFPIRVLLEIRGCGFFHKGERFLRLSGLGLAMFLSGVPGSSLATPRVALPYIRGFPTATVEVPLTLRYGTNDLRDVVGLQADVTFSGGQVDVGPIESGTAMDNHVIRLSQPVAGTVPVGTNVTLSVTAHGSAPISYQWYYNSGLLTGATNSTLCATRLRAWRGWVRGSESGPVLPPVPAPSGSAAPGASPDTSGKSSPGPAASSDAISTAE